MGISSAFKQLGVPTGTVGAISELRVCVDLLSRGFEVFRAVSQSCSCDLAILKSGQLLRIEVKTGYKRTDGKPIFSKIVHKADILALCYPTEIIYQPALPI